jgi:hypothetical protein
MQHPNERTTAVLLDRKPHNCHIFRLNFAENYRFRKSVKESQSAQTRRRGNKQGTPVQVRASRR